MIDHTGRPGDFDGLAANYERFRIGYSSELYDVLEKHGFRRGASVLDVACGTGISLEPLVARGLNLTGIDPAAEMLAFARQRVPAATFVNATVEALPFADASFDGAICAQAFHWFEADAAFTAILRVVKPGGPVAVWWKILSSDDPMRALRHAACARAGVEPGADLLQSGFGAFYRAPFAARTLRVLPLLGRYSIDEWIGYERSRASARNLYGARNEAYFDALRAELGARYGSPAAQIDVRYTQFLYLGTTAAR